MKKILHKAAEYLGQELFELYKEKHPVINVDTDVVLVCRDYARLGFQIREPQLTSVFNMSPTVMTKIITIRPEDFETWALSKDGPYWRLAFVEPLNRLYVATLEN